MTNKGNLIKKIDLNKLCSKLVESIKFKRR